MQQRWHDLLFAHWPIPGETIRQALPRGLELDTFDGAAWIGGYLGNRCLSIAGGTSKIQRNVIAERLLGLPKDP